MLGTIRQSFRDERGNTSVLFALSVIPMALAAGTAIDYGRAAALRSKLQAVTDSVTLSLCKLPATTTTAEMQKTALASMQSYFPTNTITLDPLQVTTNPRQVTLASRTNYPTLVVRIGKIDNIPLGTMATCSAQETFFEIALVLDNTGSMNSSSGSQSKLDALKKAATKFTDYMFTNGSMPGKLKVSLVPFSAAVAVDPVTFRNASWIDQAGKSKYHWDNIVAANASGFNNRFDVFAKLKGKFASWDWAGCLESLPYPQNVEDGAPSSGNKDSYYVPMLAPDEAGTGGSILSASGSSSPNSYIDDGFSTRRRAACNTAGSDSQNMGQACKYTNPANATRTNTAGDSRIGPNWMCRTQPLTRLSTDRNAVESKINAMVGDGNTNIHEGFSWGWRTLSPLSVFADGAPYSDLKTKKVVVLMTDGMNTWGVNSANTVTKSSYSAYGYVNNVTGTGPNGRLSSAAQISATSPSEGQARAAMDRLTREACANARNAGIIVFTVGFSVPTDPIDAQGLKLLSDCAGSAERSFVATNDQDLIDKFQLIAQGIGNLRLTR